MARKSQGQTENVRIVILKQNLTQLYTPLLKLVSNFLCTMAFMLHPISLISSPPAKTFIA